MVSVPERIARITMQYIGGSSWGRRVRQESSLGADQRVSSCGRRRVTSAGAIREPASNVKVRRDRRTKMAMQILLSELEGGGSYRFSDSLAIQFVHVFWGW